MKTLNRVVILVVVATAAIALLALSSDRGATNRATAGKVERGRYLVTVLDCNACHTPLKLGPNGPEPDMTRMLSGHPEGMELGPVPALTGGWVAAAAGTNTAWAGPWGISYTANLTPDPVTGLGPWSEDIFIRALRTGRHWGQSRPILPPMPWQAYGQLTDDDLSAIFAYLRSIPPVRNQVPDALVAPAPGETPTDGAPGL